MNPHFVPTVDGFWFAVGHYAALVLLGLISFAIGRTLTTRVSFNNPLETISFSVALGLGAISFLIFLLGLFHLLYPPVLLVSLLICLIPASRLPGQLLRSVKGKWPTKSSRILQWALLIAVILVVSAPFFILPLYPPTVWDTIQYHLAAPKIYMQQHALTFTPYLRYPVFPQTNQMLFTGALLLYDDVLAHLIQFLMMLTLAAAMIGFGKRHLTSRAGWWAAAALLATHLVIWLGSTAMVDAGLMLFVFLSAYALWNWYQEKEFFWLVLSGIFSGLAFGSKFTGAVFPVIYCASLLATSSRRHRFLAPLVLGGVALLVASPWLLRGIFYSGNPIFPFFEEFFVSIFGQRQVDPAGFSDQVEGSIWIGSPRTLVSLLKLPWNLIFEQHLFIPEAPFSKICFVLLPLTSVIAYFNPKIRWLLLLAIAYTVFWFFGYQILRYLTPALPFYCLATAGAVDWLISRIADRSGWSARLDSGVLTGLVCVAVLYSSWYYVARRVRWEGPIPVSVADRDRYLTARLPSYAAYQFLNSHAGDDYRLYALDMNRMAYFADGLFMGDLYGDARYSRITSRLNSSEALYHELSRLGASHFLINYDVEKSRLPQDEFFSRHFKQIFSGNNTEVYEISDK